MGYGAELEGTAVAVEPLQAGPGGGEPEPVAPGRGGEIRAVVPYRQLEIAVGAERADRHPTDIPAGRHAIANRILDQRLEKKGGHQESLHVGRDLPGDDQAVGESG